MKNLSISISYDEAKNYVKTVLQVGPSYHHNLRKILDAINDSIDQVLDEIENIDDCVLEVTSKNSKIGDEVWSPIFGYGDIVNIAQHIVVKDDCGKLHGFARNGKILHRDMNAYLFKSPLPEHRLEVAVSPAIHDKLWSPRFGFGYVKSIIGNNVTISFISGMYTFYNGKYDGDMYPSLFYKDFLYLEQEVTAAIKVPVQDKEKDTDDIYHCIMNRPKDIQPNICHEDFWKEEKNLFDSYVIIDSLYENVCHEIFCKEDLTTIILLLGGIQKLVIKYGLLVMDMEL